MTLPTPALNEFSPPPRVLLGPGPSNLPPEVVQALAAPLVGYMDPELFKTMDDIAALLKVLFDAPGHLTLAISGTGTAGMEASLYNLLEPGDRVVACVCGYFGARMAEIAQRAGAEVARVEAEWGRAVEPQQVAQALGKGRTKLVTSVQGETSTGVEQPLEEICRLAREHEALTVVDTVASLGGVPISLSALDVDACYSGSQKCLSAPPGLAPIAFGPRAQEALAQRKTPVASWYLDLSLIAKYWGESRTYHHTAPSNLLYALREALRLVVEEGLEARWERHRRNAQALVSGLEALGLRPFADPAHRLASVTSLWVPEGVDDAKVRASLLRDYSIEIGGGLGAYRGKIWRIGLMGYSCSAANVLLVLSALEKALKG